MKRLIDIVISAVSIIVLSPVFFSIAVLVAWKMGRPVVFVQKRPGKDGRLFNMYKFRSMSQQKDSRGELLSDDERLLPFGKFLRKTSLDELPELWNVLRGDMSLIGPRPLLEEYLPLYSAEQARRHEMRPGITGWAQVNGRNLLSWEDRFKMDVWYVDHHSIILDVKIAWMTVGKVFRQEGVSSKNTATIDRFDGNRSQVDFLDGTKK